MSTNEKSNNPVVFSPWDWISQMVIIIYQNPKEMGFNVSEGIDSPMKGSKQANSKSSLLPCSYQGCHRKVWSLLEVDLPTSNDLD